MLIKWLRVEFGSLPRIGEEVLVAWAPGAFALCARMAVVMRVNEDGEEAWYDQFGQKIKPPTWWLGVPAVPREVPA